MADDETDPPPLEDQFAESDEWIAAEGRQLFRALVGYDPKAVEVALFYLTDFLAKTLGRHLRAAGRWDIPGLWFDGLDAPDVDADPPARLRIRAWLVCVARDNRDWWREPFEFDLRLCPRTGQFRGYRFRAGDHRPPGGQGVGRAGGRDVEAYRGGPVPGRGVAAGRPRAGRGLAGRDRPRGVPLRRGGGRTQRGTGSRPLIRFT